MKSRIDIWLASAVFGHLAVTFAHGAAHSGAHVPLDRASTLFVLLVIELAPVAGFVLSIRRPRLGAALVAASMAASLVFGIVNHFMIISPDHVSEVAVRWRPLFAVTAGLLVAFEAAGVLVALRRLRRTAEVLS